MNAEERATQYDKIGEQYIKAQERFFESNPDPTRDFIRRVLDKEKNKLNWEIGERKLLDLGCGNGKDLLKYLKNGFDAYGTDASKFMIDEASRSVEPERLRISNHTNIPFREGFFDTVVSRFSLHYINAEELQKAYEQVSKVLRPAGMFIGVARHPLLDLMASPSKEYFKEEATSLRLYNDTVPVTTPTHTISDYLSPTLLKLFDLVSFEEGTDQVDLMSELEFKVPNYIAIAATKR